MNTLSERMLSSVCRVPRRVRASSVSISLRWSLGSSARWALSIPKERNHDLQVFSLALAIYPQEGLDECRLLTSPSSIHNEQTMLKTFCEIPKTLELRNVSCVLSTPYRRHDGLFVNLVMLFAINLCFRCLLVGCEYQVKNKCFSETP
jgi:hypothetical protein